MTAKPKVSIKKSRRGAFTRWCKSHGYKSVTAKCIKEGLASRYASVRKMANFARNSKGWKK